MDIFYVASREHYTLVTAIDNAEAWIAGHSALHNLHAVLFEQTGQDVPVEIQTVRLATAEEISKWNSSETNSNAQDPVWMIGGNPV